MSSCVGGDKRGLIQFLGQQLAKLHHFKPGQGVAFLVVEGRRIGLQGNTQFATIVYIVYQFGLSKGLARGNKSNRPGRMRMSL